ncbi:MAG: hypothetical protein M1837_005132 [Sclerophora amabilis]|nr:MAG: hypothetical protein M1837_005132 [Sclerophora amabilis]
MDSGEAETRAEALALRAIELLSSGNSQEAFRAIREAALIAPEHPQVKDAFAKLRREEDTNPVLRSCRDFVIQGDEHVAREGLQYLRQADAQIPYDVGHECAKLLIEDYRLRTPLPDELLALLIQQSLGCQSYLMTRLEEATNNELFEYFWEIGDRTVFALLSISLNRSIWKLEKTRERCEQDIFVLLIAKLMEVEEDHKARALKGLLRLLEADAERLAELVDEDSFHTILAMLDTRSMTEVRNYATMTTAKFIEIQQEIGQTWLTNFITARIAAGTNEDLILAFSTASAVFPILPSVAAALFLTEGFVEALVPLLQKKAKSSRVVQAALEMLNAACINRNCRQAIRKNCVEWLEDMVTTGASQSAGTAVVILAKVSGTEIEGKAEPSEAQSGPPVDVEEVVKRLKDLMNAENEQIKQIAIEGLAYSSLQPKVKEQLSKDQAFLKGLVVFLDTSVDKSTTTFGCLSIIVNLTSYLPNLSEEQKRMGQLKAYANASKGKTQPDPLDEDVKVSARCKALLDVGVAPVLVSKSKKISQAALSHMLTIFLSLTREQKHRGQIAQQGAVRLLLQAYASLSGDSAANIQSRRNAAHGLARILISVNPALVFNSSAALATSSSIRPLLSLLEDDSTSEQRDLLPTFEALLALTNVASTDDLSREAIICLAWPRIEDLLLSRNTLVQRATVELVCNLMVSPEAVAKFADGSPQAKNRLHTLLALADVDDVATRRAAGGGLAMLTEWDAAVNAVVERERGVKILLGLCQDDEQDLVHRGCVCIRNVVSAPGAVGKLGADKVKHEGGVEALKGMLRLTRNPEILEVGVEALKILVE